MSIFFYIFSFISVLSTILVIFQKNPLYSLLYLIISFLSFSGIYFSIGAFFIGALETIIYSGAIMVLFVFAIMVLNLGEQTINEEKRLFSKKLFYFSLSLSITMFFIIFHVISRIPDVLINLNLHDMNLIGIALFNKYIWFVEFSSMLLLAALIIVFHLFHNKKYIRSE
ncbi:MAG: NADH-quinone oxidoreductase subunit J [Buchnera aphidicola (Periphyllus acericola)]|uniref:NADH-quinone oxidoreductase subunit J n=1 Tax=Buchnera aphidicola TaxID=9 RepID=UPI0030CAAF07|nr:NADH-quinone oxidoreductase subunit J [Buchnera aphidicola (Periphyllus acericola)]